MSMLLEVLDPFELWDWTGDNWLPGTYDEYAGGMGAPPIDLPTGTTPTDTATVTSSYMTCDPNQVLVSSPDWAAPVCMTSDMAIAFGKGLQQQATPAWYKQIPPSSLTWLALGAVGLLLLGAVGGRRR